MQQSICYDKINQWTVSVSWGFAVQIIRGIMSPREIEMPARTFLNWKRRADYTMYAFNTRPLARNPCQRPYVYYMSDARFDAAKRTTVTQYDLNGTDRLACQWKMADPAEILDHIVVYKKPDPGLLDRVIDSFFNPLFDLDHILVFYFTILVHLQLSFSCLIFIVFFMQAQ
jgi:Protein of unknown function, DUF604